MGYSPIEEKVIRIIADQISCNLEIVTPEKSLRELGAASLDVIEIEMAIENQFGFRDGALFETELHTGLTVEQIIHRARECYIDDDCLTQ